MEVKWLSDNHWHMSVTDTGILINKKSNIMSTKFCGYYLDCKMMCLTEQGMRFYCSGSPWVM